MKAGDILPPLDVPVTRTLIVSGALASRDFQEVHHDAEAARAQGAKDIFMNILTTNGLVSRLVTDWAGPKVVVKGISLRLGVPNYPGDTMRLTGSVKSVSGDEADVEVRGANSLGDHVVATVRVKR
jgi:3-oxo-4,17-pregnadiene-20-carboxyl-CoA hydratase beta subunit